MNFKKLTETDRIVYKKFFEDFYSIPCFLKKIIEKIRKILFSCE